MSKQREAIMAAAWPGLALRANHLTHRTSVEHRAMPLAATEPTPKEQGHNIVSVSRRSGINSIPLVKLLEATDHLPSTVGSPFHQRALPNPRCFPVREGSHTTYATTTDVGVTLTITQRLNSASSPRHNSYLQLLSEVPGPRCPGSRWTSNRGQRSPHL